MPKVFCICSIEVVNALQFFFGPELGGCATSCGASMTFHFGQDFASPSIALVFHHKMEEKCYNDDPASGNHLLWRFKRTDDANVVTFLVQRQGHEPDRVDLHLTYVPLLACYISRQCKPTIPHRTIQWSRSIKCLGRICTLCKVSLWVPS